MSRPQTYDEAKRDHELTRLFVANQLGPDPGSDEARDAAIRRASTALELSSLEEAARARRILAIESTAWHATDYVDDESEELIPPSHELWEQAIAIVDMATDEEVRRMARGGMVFRAAQEWNDDH